MHTHGLLPRHRGAPGARLLVYAAALVATLATAGCRGGERTSAGETATAGATGAPPAADPSYRRAPGYVVDSILPIDEALRRFRDSLSPAVRLEGGAASREALVRQFVRSIERADTAALRRMELTRAEFAYLVYPSSPYTHPPYREQPEIVWLVQQQGGETGRRRLLERFAGRPLHVSDYRCDPAPSIEGENRLWRGCRLRYRRREGTEATCALFGVIVERGGRFKFVNYANDL